MKTFDPVISEEMGSDGWHVVDTSHEEVAELATWSDDWSLSEARTILNHYADNEHAEWDDLCTWANMVDLAEGDLKIARYFEAIVLVDRDGGPRPRKSAALESRLVKWRESRGEITC